MYLSALPYAVVTLMAALLGIAIGLGHSSAVLLVLVPILAVIVANLSGPNRWIVILLAFGAEFLGTWLSGPIPIGGANLYVADLLVAGAVGGFALEWLLKPSHLRPHLPRTAVLGLPLLVFVVALSNGALQGHERYGATLFGNPLRLAGYAAIVAALPGLTPSRALRGLTIVLYGGVVWLAVTAAYHIATGTSATDYNNLSTGGIRYLGVTAATYAAAAFLLALVNLSARNGRALLHLSVMLIAGFDVIVAYTRSVWLVLAVVVVVCVLVSPAIRRALVESIPVAIPILVLGVLMISTLAPQLFPTLADRLTTPAGEDTSVQWRALAYQAVLAGTSEEPIGGIGFGRVTTFSINSEPVVIDSDPHNGFIYVFAGAGAIGVGALAIVLFTYLGGVAARWRRSEGDARRLLAWSVMLWVLMLSHALSEPVFTEPSSIIIFWISMLMPAIVGTRAVLPALLPRGQDLVPRLQMSMR